MSEWKENPGYCPVDPEVIVDLRFRDGKELTSVMAEEFVWADSMADDDVTHYRLTRDDFSSNVNIERDRTGRWWLEIPYSATFDDIAKAWEALNNG